MGTLAQGVLAIILGVGGFLGLFWLLNFLTERLPGVWEDRIKPWVFIAPAMFVVTAFLVFPAIDTIRASFYGRRGEDFVGSQNYEYLVTDDTLLGAFWNNLLWIIFVPTLAVAIGLAVATLADRLRPRWESISKSLIFLPMAISFVGASTIWGFMYFWRPEGQAQIGLITAAWGSVFGHPDAPFLQNQAINDFLLMAIMIWLQAGFAMVLLSAAIKNVPEDTIEAARIDGATEWQIFWRVVVPQIRSTIVVVGTTILILVLKVFDIVRVLTNGNFGTEVVANEFYDQLFTQRDAGKAAVIVVALMVATIPFMYTNIQRFREQEALR